MKSTIVILGALVLPYIQARYLLMELVNPLEPGEVKYDRNKIPSDMAKEDYHNHAALDYEPMVENIYDQYLSGSSGMYHQVQEYIYKPTFVGYFDLLRNISGTIAR